MSELKPCPFCGEKATLDYSVLPNSKHWFITCDRCGMKYQDTISQRKYIKDGWNTRPIEDDLRKRIAELEALVNVSEGLYERIYEQAARIAELEADNAEFRQLIRDWSIVLDQNNGFELSHVEGVRQAMLKIVKGA